MLALAALIGMSLAVALIIIASVGASEDDSGDNGSDSKGAATECTPGAEKAVKAGYYILKEGEDLSVVADKTCVEVERIERLNPNLDPMALPPRGCVDLVTDGCQALAAQS